MSKEDFLEKAEAYSVWGDMPSKEGDFILVKDALFLMEEYAEAKSKEVAIEFIQWADEII